jgi:signal transduction histidine kinase
MPLRKIAQYFRHNNAATKNINQPKHLFKKGARLFKSKKRVSLRRYWTSRYLLTLCIGLAVVAIVSALWIRYTTLENRLSMMSFMAENMVDRIVASDKQGYGQGPPDLFNKREMKTQLEISPYTYIVDSEGKIVSSDRPTGPMEQRLHPSIMESDETVLELTMADQKFYVVKSPIELDDSVIGWVVMVDSKDNLTHVDQEYTQLAIMIVSLALLGWGAINVLSTRLSKPIRDVAQAAKLVAEGNYQVDLSNDQAREKEVYDLIQSFKEMTLKLERLESLRTELLAGVTHELKTPVTSISGLLQAMKDGVVTGEDAKKFLNISLNETEKMKTMVEDLLAFNQFATNAVQVDKKLHDINDVVEAAAYGWQITQKEGDIDVVLSLLPNSVEINIDPIRFQQITTNLLNNAKQAMENKGEIHVTLTDVEDHIFIDVSDTGSGIPEAEQPFIFERFFRGEKKKYKIRGLGLGLSLSKMIAQTLGGDLVLLDSSPAGTTFRIILPIEKNI